MMGRSLIGSTGLRFMMGALVLAGCATASPRPEPAPSEIPAASTIADVGARPGALNEYLLQAGDQLTVRFYHHPDHDQEVAIRPDGRIALRGVGEVEVAGQSPDAAARRIATLYGVHLRDPEVSVHVVRFAGQRIYVGGEVGKPGFVPLASGMTTLQAVVEAGGFRDTARMKNVVVVRRSPGTNGPHLEGILVDLEAVVEAGDLSKDLELQPSDIVFVPKTSIAKANDWVEKYILRMLPIRPSWGFSF
jgi:protein involved in polysaccharide export with SLBB domain